jgi:hypothetical protein
MPACRGIFETPENNTENVNFEFQKNQRRDAEIMTKIGSIRLGSKWYHYYRNEKIKNREDAICWMLNVFHDGRFVNGGMSVTAVDEGNIEDSVGVYREIDDDEKFLADQKDREHLQLLLEAEYDGQSFALSMDTDTMRIILYYPGADMSDVVGLSILLELED